jgi:hypothetical protein
MIGVLHGLNLERTSSERAARLPASYRILIGETHVASSVGAPGRLKGALNDAAAVEYRAGYIAFREVNQRLESAAPSPYFVK